MAKLALEPSPFSFGKIIFEPRCLRVKIPGTISSDNYHDYCHKQVLGWLKAQARSTLNLEVYNLCQKYGLRYKNVAIKDTRSRWGSCSCQTNLNFNWRLIMTPPEVLRYVVIHETAHLQEMNHSQRFWALVAQRCPDYDLHKRWLHKNGNELLNWDLRFS